MPGSDKPPLVEFDRVDFAYDERPVLGGIDLRVTRGEVVAVMGASGGGKTTMLRLIGGQLRPSAGVVRFDGEAVASMSHARL